MASTQSFARAIIATVGSALVKKLGTGAQATADSAGSNGASVWASARS